jgi:spoIIIJ-associated protein
MGEQTKQEQQWLEELLQLMGFSTQVTRQAVEAGMQSDWLVIESKTLNPDQIQALIGDNGRTLDAIQYLANTQLNLGLPDSEQRPITIELGDYRHQRLVALQALAEELVQQVRQTGEEAATQPLSAAERKQVHHFLSALEDVVTESQGKEPERYVIARLRS